MSTGGGLARSGAIRGYLDGLNGHGLPHAIAIATRRDAYAFRGYRVHGALSDPRIGLQCVSGSQPSRLPEMIRGEERFSLKELHLHTDLTRVLLTRPTGPRLKEAP